ncbi:MAG: hypothetical protein HY706_09245 [Candidatus Hydrogenedentes bacterium]|nr:hypothetical protein [Candidatus Hydrogenedentota bacterium]
MSNPALTSRMQDFFSRQIAWYERTLRDLGDLETRLKEPELQPLEEQRRTHVEGSALLEKEFRALVKEWQHSQDLSAAERDEVRKSAQGAYQLANQIIAVQTRGANLADERLAALRGTLNEIRRGRDLLRKYGGQLVLDASYIDRKI